MTVNIKWLGHACVLLEYENKTILIDPWLDNPKFPGPEHKPTKVDVLLITHGHNDHFGNAVEFAKEVKPAMIPVMHEMSVYLAAKGVENAVGMNYGGIVDHEGIKIAMVPAMHSAGFNDNGEMVHMGSPGGYIIAFPDGNIVYHSGDTMAFSDMSVLADLYSPTIGLLSIGGHYTMGPKQAAYAAKLMNLKEIIPIHYGTFVPPLNGTPEKLVQHLNGTGIAVHALKPGESHEFSAMDEHEQYQSFYT